MVGYWERPDETAEMIRDGWVYTGDLGYMDEDGYLFIVDRKKDLIKPGGFQVWPREVEEVIATHPAVAEVSVAGVPDEYQGEAVKAWVVLREGQQVTRRRAARLLPRAAEPGTRCRSTSSSATRCPRRWSARCCGANWSKTRRAKDVVFASVAAVLDFKQRNQLEAMDDQQGTLTRSRLTTPRAVGRSPASCFRSCSSPAWRSSVSPSPPIRVTRDCGLPGM